MLRSRLRPANVVKVAAGVIAAGGLLAACAPIQMGAAATVGNQRISANTVQSQVSALTKAAKPYAQSLQLSQSTMPKEVLTWLVRFDVRNQLARREGITVSHSQVQQGLRLIDDEAKAQAAQSGVTNVSLTEVAVANGLPPDLLSELGRYQAIEDAYVQRGNGGTFPTSQTKLAAGAQQFSAAECSAYQNVSIKISPEFGRLDYSQHAVVAAPYTLSAAEGSPKSGNGNGGHAPSC